jgi:hypothetical protein
VSLSSTERVCMFRLIFAFRFGYTSTNFGRGVPGTTLLWSRWAMIRPGALRKHEKGRIGSPNDRRSVPFGMKIIRSKAVGPTGKTCLDLPHLSPKPMAENWTISRTAQKRSWKTRAMHWTHGGARKLV